MVNINRRRTYVPVVAISLFVLISLLVGLILTQRIALAAPADINVTIFNHEDSHPDPGDGCSLYEASIAASTHAPYGGCPAGSVDGTTILLDEGTYQYVDDPMPLLVELVDTSLVGSSLNGTIIDGYDIEMLGDEANTIELLTFNNSQPQSTSIYISGSNKTISNVEILRPVTAQGAIYIDNDSVGVSNTTIENVLIETLAGGLITCNGDCAGVTLSAVEINTSSASAMVSLQSAQEVVATDIIVASNVYSVLGVGENSSIDGLEITTQCGGNEITVGAGTVVNDVTQTAANGCGISFNGPADSITNVRQYMGGGGVLNFNADADLVDGLSQAMNPTSGGHISFNASVRETKNYTVNGAGWSYINGYEGSIISSFDVKPYGSVSHFEAQADLVEDLSIDRSGAVIGSPINFANDRNDSVIRNINLVAEETDPGATATIHGEDVEIDTFYIDTPSDSAGYLSIEDRDATLNNIYIKGGNLLVDEPGDFILENFTISDSLPGVTGPSIRMPFADGNIEIRNGVISGVAGGVYVEGDFFNPVGSLLIENVQFDNLSGTGSPQGVAYVSGIDEVTIKNITSNRTVNPDQQGAISIYSGTSHNISNTTLVDGTGGIAFFQGPQPAEVNINNVTILNNENSTEHQVSGYSFAIHASLLDDTGFVYVNNSIIGGTSPYVECSDNEVPDTNLFLSNTIATDSSCADFGATNVSSMAAVLQSSVADNGGVGADIGFEGGFGKLMTLALVPNSDNSALLAGDSLTCEGFDARGVERPSGMCDLGAFQLSSVVSGGGGGDSGDGAGNDPDAPNTGLKTASSSFAVLILLGVASIAVGLSSYLKSRLR